MNVHVCSMFTFASIYIFRAIFATHVFIEHKYLCDIKCVFRSKSTHLSDRIFISLVIIHSFSEIKNVIKRWLNLEIMLIDHRKISLTNWIYSKNKMKIVIKKEYIQLNFNIVRWTLLIEIDFEIFSVRIDQFIDIKQPASQPVSKQQ